MGSEGYILLDAMDELELVESKGMGSGYKIYENLEQRCEKKISKIILGHSDALDSTSGKLGSSEGKESPAHMALKDKQAADGAFVEDVINGILIPKMINLGFNIDPRFKFKFSNNREIIEAREEEDEAIKRVSEYVKTLSDAGVKVDPKWIAERTGIPVLDLIPVPVVVPQFTNRVKNKLNELYNYKGK
jgi:phage gp29-like protein